jgi:hypothetical protein
MINAAPSISAWMNLRMNLSFVLHSGPLGGPFAYTEAPDKNFGGCVCLVYDKSGGPEKVWGGKDEDA